VRFFTLNKALGAKCRPNAAQRLRVMPQVGSHRRCEREVLSCREIVSGPGQREAEAELRVVIARAGVHDAAEAASSLDVMPRVELRASERLEDAARVGLSSSRALEELGRRGGAAAPE